MSHPWRPESAWGGALGSPQQGKAGSRGVGGASPSFWKHPLSEKTLGASNCLEPHLPVSRILIHNKRREDMG